MPCLHHDWRDRVDGRGNDPCGTAGASPWWRRDGSRRAAVVNEGLSPSVGCADQETSVSGTHAAVPQAADSPTRWARDVANAFLKGDSDRDYSRWPYWLLSLCDYVDDLRAERDGALRQARYCQVAFNELARQVGGGVSRETRESPGEASAAASTPADGGGRGLAVRRDSCRCDAEGVSRDDECRYGDGCSA